MSFPCDIDIALQYNGRPFKPSPRLGPNGSEEAKEVSYDVKRQETFPCAIC